MRTLSALGVLPAKPRKVEQKPNHALHQAAARVRMVDRSRPKLGQVLIARPTLGIVRLAQTEHHRAKTMVQPLVLPETASARVCKDGRAIIVQHPHQPPLPLLPKRAPSQPLL